MVGMEEGRSVWTWEEDKGFEMALANTAEEGSEKWEKIAAVVSGKTVDDVKTHYQLLLEDISNIELGHVSLPCYVSSSEGSADIVEDESGSGNRNGRRSSKSEQERRRGIAWTEDEHRLFLLGLDKYGKGDWRSISRNFVITRTPTQVASHAQKYFIRLNSMNRERRRTSIHDITSVGDGSLKSPEGPITGQTNILTSTPWNSSNNPSGSAGPAVYEAPVIGKPVGGSIPAVGTSVSIPCIPQVTYGFQTPIVGGTVPGAPMNIPTTTNCTVHDATNK